jgi:hypothetical protein
VLSDAEQEWWVFIGVIISAGPRGKGGHKLWEKQTEGRSVTVPVNYGPDGLGIMAYYRFNEIKAAFPWSFQDKSKEEDPWNMVLLLVNGYNQNQHNWVAASVRKVLDESMSAYRPCTSNTGGLPNISFILRKPEPLGTEFKTIACTAIGKKMLLKAPSWCLFALILWHIRFGLKPCCGLLGPLLLSRYIFSNQEHQTKNAGSTKLGDPYIAKFPDEHGNVAQRSVPRPDVISKYFNDSNVIATHNQSRQFELALEKRWVTHDCFSGLTPRSSA